MPDKPHHQPCQPRQPRQPRQPHSDPIQNAISKWTSTISPPTDDAAAASAWAQELSSNAPKRFTIYEPMVLLPAGSFGNPPWTAELARHSAAVTDSLWTALLQELSRNGGGSKSPSLTHLAANEGIPLLRDDRDQGGGGSGGSGGKRGEENVMRSPSGLRMLHGDFGPPEPDCPPSRDDFANAFWVSTKQNGILQTWAPRWTMFSRGNVKEKARLLRFPRARPGSEEEGGGGGGRGRVWAVDLYAGIGYFAFCYAKLGMRVLCWELNPWSVEALRRGARLNKWSVDVFSRPGKSVPSEAMMASTARIVLLAEDNGIARWRTEDMRRRGGPSWLRDVRHVNCGLLPTSRLTWDCALSLTRTTTAAGQPAWLHLHENVAEADVEPRRREIELLLGGSPGEDGLNRCIRVDRVEKVKTYAPGVWHCVFDVLVTRRE